MKCVQISFLIWLVSIFLLTLTEILLDGKLLYKHFPIFKFLNSYIKNASIPKNSIVLIFTLSVPFDMSHVRYILVTINM